MICKFCHVEFNKRGGHANHVRRCPKNPMCQHELITTEGRARISAATTKQNLIKWKDPEIIAKHKKSMQQVAITRPESYSSGNRGRAKQIIVDGIKFIGQWEVDFYNWAKHAGLSPSRPTTGFAYTWNGERTYYPDFYLPTLDVYVEVKGYETDRDRAKWIAFPKKLCIIREAEIKQIRSGCFVGL